MQVARKEPRGLKEEKGERKCICLSVFIEREGENRIGASTRPEIVDYISRALGIVEEHGSDSPQMPTNVRPMHPISSAKNSKKNCQKTHQFHISPGVAPTLPLPVRHQINITV